MYLYTLEILFGEELTLENECCSMQSSMVALRRKMVADTPKALPFGVTSGNVLKGSSTHRNRRASLSSWAMESMLSLYYWLVQACVHEITVSQYDVKDVPSKMGSDIQAVVHERSCCLQPGIIN